MRDDDDNDGNDVDGDDDSSVAILSQAAGGCPPAGDRAGPWVHAGCMRSMPGTGVMSYDGDVPVALDRNADAVSYNGDALVAYDKNRKRKTTAAAIAAGSRVLVHTKFILILAFIVVLV